MTRVRFEPLREFTTFQNEVNRLFNGAGVAEPATTDKAVWVPPVDVLDSEAAIVVTLDVPGVSKDDISIELDGCELTVSGERVRAAGDGEASYQRTERRFGSFARTLRLADGVDEAAISADYAAGVLTVTIPKPEEQKPRKIEISGS